MSIVIEWENPNTDSVLNTRVLRKADDETSFSLIGEVTSETLSYTDPDVENGKSYSYKVIFNTTLGGVVPIYDVRATVLPNLGPGSTVVTKGDLDFGVMDVLAENDLISFSDLDSYLQTNYGLSNPSVLNGDPCWYKCLVDGNIILIPAGYFINLGTGNVRQTGDRLSALKLISVPDSGTGYNFENCPIIEIGEYQYRYRGMKHWYGDPEDLTESLQDCGPNSDGVHDITLKTEFNLLYNCMLRTIDDVEGEEASFIAGEILPPAGVYSSNSYYFIQGMGNIAFPSAANLNTSKSIGYSTTQAAALRVPRYGALKTSVLPMHVVPVLELIQPESVTEVPEAYIGEL